MITIRETHDFVEIQVNEIEATVFAIGADRYIQEFKDAIEALEKLKQSKPFNDLHIAAFMDIEQTTGSLQHLLEYKKELAARMLRCSDEKELELYAEALKHAEGLIKKVLGMCL